MNDLPLGAKGSYTMTVTAEHLANRFKDPTLPAVFSTPVMIMAMENAALEAIKPPIWNAARAQWAVALMSGTWPPPPLGGW